MIESLVSSPTPTPPPSGLGSVFVTSQFFAALVTAIVGALALLVGAQFRPRVERRVRNEEADDAERKRWRDHGIELVGDLSDLLIELAQTDDDERVKLARTRWVTELRRRCGLLSRFTEDDRVRIVTLALRSAVEELGDSAAKANARRTHPNADSFQSAHQRNHHKANYALSKLTEALGGEKVPDDDAWEAMGFTPPDHLKKL